MNEAKVILETVMREMLNIKSCKGLIPTGYQKLGKGKSVQVVSMNTDAGKVIKRSKPLPILETESSGENHIIVNCDPNTLLFFNLLMFREISNKREDLRIETIDGESLDLPNPCKEQDGHGSYRYISNLAQGGDLTGYIKGLHESEAEADSQPTHGQRGFKGIDRRDIQKLVEIYKTVIKYNDELYTICQFQHCDMKTAQIFLDVSETDPQNFEPILADIDKSTTGFKFKHNSVDYKVRLRLKLGGSTNDKVNEPTTINKGSNVYVSDPAGTSHRARSVDSSLITYINAHKPIILWGERWLSYGVNPVEVTKDLDNEEELIKIMNNKLNEIRGGMFLPNRVDVAAWLHLISKQESERFESMPYTDNKFYNYCLLASILLLLPQRIYSIFTHDNKISKDIKAGINISVVEENRGKHSLKDLEGHKIATTCVKFEGTRATSVNPQIELVVGIGENTGRFSLPASALPSWPSDQHGGHKKRRKKRNLSTKRKTKKKIYRTRRYKTKRRVKKNKSKRRVKKNKSKRKSKKH